MASEMFVYLLECFLYSLNAEKVASASKFQAESHFTPYPYIYPPKWRVMENSVFKFGRHYPLMTSSTVTPSSTSEHSCQCSENT